MMQKLQQSLPIIPWMGGKRRLAKHLLPMFPKHSCYVELFSGGAALFFLRPTAAKVEVLNDINGQLINLYRPSTFWHGYHVKSVGCVANQS